MTAQALRDVDSFIDALTTLKPKIHDMLKHYQRYEDFIYDFHESCMNDGNSRAGNDAYNYYLKKRRWARDTLLAEDSMWNKIPRLYNGARRLRGELKEFQKVPRPRGEEPIVYTDVYNE